MKLEWSDVELFLVVVRTGSLRAAARALRVDVSTVSRRLTQLEHSAGERLLRRERRSLGVTVAGQQLLSTAERMEDELASAARKIARSNSRVEGVVRVSCPNALRAVVASACRSLRDSHPAITVELLSTDALASVDGTQIDLAVRIADAPPEALVGSAVAKLRSAIYASHECVERTSLALEDPGREWIEWDRRLLTKPAFQWLHEAFAARAVVARGLSTQDVLALVREGVGTAALPRIVGDAEPSLVRLAEIPANLATKIWVLTHGELRDAARVRVVMTAIRAAITAVKERL